ncbi:hypothetical protein AFLA_005815 [Aspergillus flavus NRRL3357]|nr:hypothetical protein AFLA_005815 [Aspergillus flavus NRRL3357]
MYDVIAERPLTLPVARFLITRHGDVPFLQVQPDYPLPNIDEKEEFREMNSAIPRSTCSTTVRNDFPRWSWRGVDFMTDYMVMVHPSPQEPGEHGESQDPSG